jgi:hypothetical protein
MTKRFKHIKTGDIYEFLKYTQIRISSSWITCIIYLKVDTLQIFIKTEDNFHELFEEIV